MKYFKLLFLVLLLSVSHSSNASHAMGGEITYTWISGNTYRLELAFYRDCSGIQPPFNIPLKYYSSCYPAYDSVMLYPSFSAQQISPVCNGVSTTCDTGTYIGIEKIIYWNYLTLPGPCNDWVFSHSECCRNMSITNLQGAAGTSLYYHALLNNIDFPFNSSVRFSNDPIPFLFTGVPNQINNGAFDPDNDSIVVSLAPAMNDSVTLIPYVSPLSAQNPVTVSTPLTIDPATGNITITPLIPEVDVIVYRVDEYRNGILIGSVSRDIQANIINGTNILPGLTGLNGSPSFITNVNAGDTLRFSVHSIDGNVSDSTRINVLPGSGLNPAVVSYGVKNDSISIEIITDASMTSPIAHVLYLEVRDNACPYYGRQTYAYQIYVNGGSTDVWPGDANNDLNCNLYDLLPIGLGYSATGPFRPGASPAWTAQPAIDWPQQFISGVNYKFADCNGDGLIDFNDTAAIAPHFGLTHPVRLQSPNQTTSVTNMQLIAGSDTVNPGQSLPVAVQLGDVNLPAHQVYGLAFRLVYNPEAIDTTTTRFRFVNSQLGTPGSDLLTMVRPYWSRNYIEAAAVRMDHQPLNIYTLIGVLDATILTNPSNQGYFGFRLADIKVITETGLELIRGAVNDSIFLTQGTTGITVPDAERFSLYPNPASDEIRFTGPQQITSATVRDMNGRIVSQTEKGWTGERIDIRSLNNGIYVAELMTSGSIIRKTFNIAR